MSIQSVSKSRGLPLWLLIAGILILAVPAPARAQDVQPFGNIYVWFGEGPVFGDISEPLPGPLVALVFDYTGTGCWANRDGGLDCGTAMSLRNANSEAGVIIWILESPDFGGPFAILATLGGITIEFLASDFPPPIISLNGVIIVPNATIGG